VPYESPKQIAQLAAKPEEVVDLALERVTLAVVGTHARDGSTTGARFAAPASG
jgi:hypothetical protein